jgi:hypothetical protein
MDVLLLAVPDLSPDLRSLLMEERGDLVEAFLLDVAAGVLS